MDELFQELDACERGAAADPAEVARVQQMAELAFRLNDISAPAVASLMRATAERMLENASSGSLPFDSFAFDPSDSLGGEETVDLEAVLRDYGPSESYFRVMDAMNAPVSNASHVAEAMADSPMLASVALLLVNGPGYGLFSRVNSLPRAVAMAGFNEISGLSLAVHLARSLGQEPGGHWLRAMVRGAYARKLAKLAGTPGDWLFAAGLLADAGELVVQRAYPGTYARMLALASRSLLARHEAEAVVLGVPISDVSARLLAAWDAPAPLVDLVRMREDPSLAGYAPAVCLLHLADIMAQATFAECGAGLPVSRLDERALDALGLPPDALEENQSAMLAQAQTLTEAFSS